MPKLRYRNCSKAAAAAGSGTRAEKRNSLIHYFGEVYSLRGGFSCPGSGLLRAKFPGCLTRLFL